MVTTVAVADASDRSGMTYLLDVFQPTRTFELAGSDGFHLRSDGESV